MEKQKMTIHRALSELKLIDSKIDRAIKEINPSGGYQQGKNINGLYSKEEFEKSAKSKYDSVNDLIDRKVRIKSEIVKSNSNTIISVSGNKMTVADAISYKSIIPQKNTLVNELRRKHNNTIAAVNSNNQKISDNCQRILEAALGKDNVQIGKSDTDSIRKPYMEANEFHIFDPIEVEKKIALIESETQDFLSEIDAVLSESNAITIIEV